MADTDFRCQNALDPATVAWLFNSMFRSMQTRLALILICIWPCAAPFLPAASWAVSQDYTGPFPPEQALRTFQLPEGFRIELVAAEPDVLDPVAMSFDEDGRLYVIEMRDYPSGPPAPPGRSGCWRTSMAMAAWTAARCSRTACPIQPGCWPERRHARHRRARSALLGGHGS